MLVTCGSVIQSNQVAPIVPYCMTFSESGLAAPVFSGTELILLVFICSTKNEQNGQKAKSLLCLYPSMPRDMDRKEGFFLPPKTLAPSPKPGGLP